MANVQKAISHWLLPIILSLFVLVILTFPIASGTTYAGRSEQPDHILTYTTGKLTWDDATGIDANGAAKLSVFDAVYQNVSSDDGSKVVAPGTENTSIIRLKNDANYAVEYTAVMYLIRTSDTQPVHVSMSAGGAAQTDSYILPDGISEARVLQAVTGTVDGGKLQDLDINWFWSYDIDEAQNAADTTLGNLAAEEKAEELTVGVYIVVEDDGIPLADQDATNKPNNGSVNKPNTDSTNSPNSGSIVKPSSPDTGDHSHMGMYLMLVCISAVMMLFLLLDRRNKQK